MREQTQEQHQKVSIRQVFSAVLIAILCMSLVVPNLAYADPTAADKQAEADAALEQLNAMQINLNKASDDYFTALEEQEQAQARMDEAQARIDTISVEIATVQGKLGTRATNMYRSGQTTILDLFLGSNSFEEFATAWDMLNRMNQEDAEMVQEAKDLRTQVEAEKAEYADQEFIAATKAEEARIIKEEAEATTAAMQEVYDNLSAEAAALLEAERIAAEAAAAAAAEAALQASINAPGGGGGNFAPTYDAVTGNIIVDRALGCRGAPYVWGATGPSSFDCSGLVGYAITGSYKRIGTTYTFLTWPKVDNPQPGDIAVNAQHCGIYLGNGQMVHAPTFGQPVSIGPVQSGMIFVRP